MAPPSHSGQIATSMLNTPLRRCTQTGELVLRLSGGQLRHLPITSVLLKDAPIMILDEPTEGHDPHTEAVMMKNILVWTGNRTLLLVTPKVRSLERMNQILMLSHGELVERGDTRVTADRQSELPSAI